MGVRQEGELWVGVWQRGEVCGGVMQLWAVMGVKLGLPFEVETPRLSTTVEAWSFSFLVLFFMTGIVTGA